MRVIKVKHDYNTVDIVLLSFVITKFIGVNEYNWAYFWGFLLGACIIACIVVAINGPEVLNK